MDFFRHIEHALGNRDLTWWNVLRWCRRFMFSVKYKHMSDSKSISVKSGKLVGSLSRAFFRWDLHMELLSFTEIQKRFLVLGNDSEFAKFRLCILCFWFFSSVSIFVAEKGFCEIWCVAKKHNIITLLWGGWTQRVYVQPGESDGVSEKLSLHDLEKLNSFCDAFRVNISFYRFP